MTVRTLHELATQQSVLICCGTGGVGKTTAAAALALSAAEDGRRAAVVTIDPARRLADAMGLAEIGNECRQVELDAPGELWATMLDTKATFDDLVRRHSTDDAQAERILGNRYYRNLTTTLSGTREYMAMEKLYELHADGRFDLVIVDTPPSRNALDFLAAPDRLTRFLEGRLFRLAMPGNRLVRSLTAPLLSFWRRVAKVVSPEVVDDTLAFLEAFAGMEDGFRSRAGDVERLLQAPTTSFVLVSAPTAAAVDESVYFADRLRRADIALDALVVNRMHPRPEVSVEELGGSGDGDALTPYRDAVADLHRLADAEAAQLRPLLDSLDPAQVTTVPLLDHDIHDLTGITEIANHLS